jgi:TRAP-type mannitol/chloroaromatic compound transport system permease large subunit
VRLFPGFALTIMYFGYVVLITFIRPQWVPALPAEARTIREDNGSSGLPSLGVLTRAEYRVGGLSGARNYARGGELLQG